MLWMAIIIPLLLAMVALGVDIAYVYHIEAQLDAGIDAATLAAAGGLAHGQDEARRRAVLYASKNSVGGDPLVLQSGDIVFGVWDSRAKRIKPTSDAGATAVKVRRDKTADYFFAGIVGFHSTEVAASATAVFRSRDIVLVLDYSGSMNDDSELTHADRLGLGEIRLSLRNIWVDLGKPVYGKMKFDPVYIGSGRYSSIRSALGLRNVPYPYPSGSWNDYFDYVRNDSTIRNAGYRRRYGYLTLMNYLQAKQPKADQTPDLWKTREQPITAVKNAVTLFLNYLRQVNTHDHVGLVSYTSKDGKDALEAQLTNNLARIEDTSRRRQAAHYHTYTNIAAGIKTGLQELRTRARPGALQMLVLLSDGKTNWRNNQYDPNGARNAARQQAHLASIEEFPIVTISLGSNADHSLMQEIADITEGVHYIVRETDDVEDTEAQLMQVFADIAAHRSLRLVR